MDLGLTNRVVLVTGGSRGIGRATAEAFASEGARIVLTYRQCRDGAEAVAESIRTRGADARVAFLDLAQLESVQEAVADTVSAWGGVDVLVNKPLASDGETAYPTTPFEEVHGDVWQPLIRANVEGAYAAIQAVLPGMRTAGWGRIVNVSSVWAADGMPGFGWYAAAKSALHGLTKALAKELAPAGILVNVVMPGLTLTERVSERLRETQPDRARFPSNQLPDPEDVASTIVFFGSAANAVITGEVVRVSGD